MNVISFFISFSLSGVEETQCDGRCPRLRADLQSRGAAQGRHRSHRFGVRRRHFPTVGRRRSLVRPPSSTVFWQISSKRLMSWSDG